MSMRFTGAEAEYTGPVIDGLQALNLPLPTPLSEALRVRAALAGHQERLYAEASTSTVPHLREKLARATLKSIADGKGIPPLADEILDAERADQRREIERAAVTEALELATSALPGKVSAAASTIERALGKKLAAVLAEVGKVADAARTMPLADPALAVRQADDAQLRAFRVISKAAEDVSKIRDVQYRLRIAQNARDADRAVAEYEDPSAASQAPQDPLSRVVWLATEAKPVVRGHEQIAEYVAAQQRPKRDPRLRGVAIAGPGARREAA